MTPSPDTTPTAYGNETLFFSAAGLDRLKANLGAVEPFEVGALIGDIRKLQAERDSLRIRLQEAEREIAAMKEQEG